MNEDPRKRRTSNITVAMVITAVTLLASAVVAWLVWTADAEEVNDIQASTTSSQPADTVSVRAKALATARILQSALAGRTTGNIEVTSDGATGSLSAIRAGVGGDLYPQVPADQPPQVKVAAFLAEHGGLLGIDDPARQLKLLGVEQDQYGHRHVSYQQMHGSVRVLGAVLKGHVTPDGRLTAINGKFVPGIDVPTSPTVARDDANRSAIARVAGLQPAVQKDVPFSVKSAALVVYRSNLTRGAAGVNHLAYEVQVIGDSQVREFVYLDATTGKFIDQISGIQGLKRRRVHEANIATPPLWQEGDLRPAVQPAHEDEVVGAGQAYNLFFNLSGGTHRSWNANDATMITVNNDPTIVCPNANWNGTSTNYCSGTSADDVIVHEWTHAYTQETSGLIYSYQSGALNESYSDVFGETVDLINNREGVEGTAATGNDGQRSQDDAVCSTYAGEPPTTDESIRWLMGEDAFAFSPLPPIGDAAIRDMWRPRCAGGAFFFGNPGHGSSDLYHCDASDAGGVHINSSINNRAYALLVDGDTVELKDDGSPFANPVTVTGIGLTKTAHIFWRANSVYNGPASNFNDNADALLMACNDLLGVNLAKLVTSAEIMTGFLGANDDTIDPTPEPSGDVITASDCQQVANTIAAVEMRHDVTAQCGFEAPLDPAPAPMCGDGTVVRQFMVDWESGIPAGWTVGQSPLTKSQLDTRPWFLRSGDLPKGRPGSAMFQENRVDLGNCSSDDESGVLFLIGPEITVAADGPGFLAFEHYFLTEAGFDGGNLMISINGGLFQPVPQLAYSVVSGSAFVHNPYNGTLNDVIDQNTNPKRGEEAFQGANPISGDNNWGTSQVDLAAAGVAPGDTIRLRWDFGQDGCNGNEGWYLDRIEVFSCGAGDPPEEGVNETTGGGWLAGSSGGKINFGFKATQTDSGFEGKLQLNDKAAGVKIDLTTVTGLGPVQGNCGPIVDSARALELRGTGSFNKNVAASFRVCVEDNGGPGKGQGASAPDRLHLECTAGCSYDLASRAADAGVDGGNLQVHRVDAPPPAEPPPEGAAILILNPVLMTEGVIGALQPFEVSVFGSDQQPLGAQSITLTSVSANGGTQTLTAIANALGKALFTVPISTKPREYQATSDGVGSNAVHVTPVL
ncbi:MAG: M4 family metallopeptidase [Steroidobacteraceae bacterium]